MTKSFFVSPGTNAPFLSVTVIGRRTRRIAIFSTPCGFSEGGVGDGDAFGYCAETESAAAMLTTATDKYLNKNDVIRSGMLHGLWFGS
jgi:hypothetical protein